MKDWETLCGLIIDMRINPLVNTKGWALFYNFYKFYLKNNNSDD